jgi:hypothetical protein
MPPYDYESVSRAHSRKIQLDGLDVGNQSRHYPHGNTRNKNHIEGKTLVWEPGVGQIHARLIGEWTDENNVVANLEQFSSNMIPAPDLPATGNMDGKFEPRQGLIWGSWKTDVGTIDDFVLVKVGGDLQIPDSLGQIAEPPLQAQPVPEPSAEVAEVKPTLPLAVQPATPQTAPLLALVTITQVLGSYRFDVHEFRALAEIVKSGTNIQVPVVNASVQGREFIHIGVESLLSDASIPAVIHDARIAASEPAANLGTNTVVLTLKHDEPSTLYVSGYDRIWVEGKAAQIQGFLRHHENKAAHLLRRYGGHLNGMIFLALLAILPSIQPLRNRFVVVFYVFVFLSALLYSWRLAENVRVFLREPRLPWYEKNAGWLLVVLEVSLAGWIGYLIQRYASF